MFQDAVFRTYDIRGLVGEDFDVVWVEQLGKACGAYMLERGLADAVVGFDCRASSPAYHDALTRGLLSTGVSVVSVGMVSTPLLYFAVKHLHRKAGVMITASHNPPQYNGFKIWVGESTIYGDDLQALKQTMKAGVFPQGQGLFSQHDIVPAYFEAVQERIALSRPMKIVVDGGNGTGGETCRRLLQSLGAEVVALYCEPDGAFPNHHPDPVVEENMRDLIDKVREEGADFGVGLDGDGDRLGVVDKSGRLLSGDELLSIYAQELLTRKPGAIVIADVKCSQRLFDDIAKHGGQGRMNATGHSLIKARMREVGAELAGEMSGHMFFEDGWHGFDDAIYGAARLAGILSHSPKALEELPGWPVAFATREINIPCPEALKPAMVRKAQEFFGGRYPVNEMDGARVQFPDGWGLIRASNTQPILVTRFEAATEVRLQAIQDEMLEPLKMWIAEGV